MRQNFTYRAAAFRALARGISLAERQAPVAQLDRALDYESRGREFESLRARHLICEHGGCLSWAEMAFSSRSLFPLMRRQEALSMAPACAAAQRKERAPVRRRSQSPVLGASMRDFHHCETPLMTKWTSNKPFQRGLGCCKQEP